MRNSARFVAASSMVLLSATLAVAQPVPPQPTGMVGPLNPVLFTQDGVPDGVGDLPGILEFADDTRAGEGTVSRGIQLNLGNVICNGASTFRVEGAPSQSGQPFDEFGRAPGEVMANEFDTSDTAHPRPISAAFQEGGSVPGLGGGASGSAFMLDADGDHAYEQMAVQGANSGGPVAATLDLRTHDADGDGLPEYVSFFDPAPVDPQFNLAVLQFYGLGCDSSPDPYTEAWVPVGRDLDGDPAVIGDLDGNGIADPEFYFGPKLAIRGPVVQIPTLSGFGIVALAAVLLLVGLRLMRRRGLAATV